MLSLKVFKFNNVKNTTLRQTTNKLSTVDFGSWTFYFVAFETPGKVNRCLGQSQPHFLHIHRTTWIK